MIKNVTITLNNDELIVVQNEKKGSGEENITCTKTENCEVHSDFNWALMWNKKRERWYYHVMWCELS